MESSVQIYQCSKCSITGNLEYIQDHLEEHIIENLSVSLSSDNQEKECDAIWTEDECLALISSYENHTDDFKNAKKRKLVWEVISDELMSLGMKRTAIKCERKWLNMVRVYKNKKDALTKTGRGALSNFKYFGKLDEILGDCHPNSSNITVDIGLNIDDTTTNTADVEVNEDNTNKKSILMQNEENTPTKKQKINASKKMEYLALKLQLKKEKRQKRDERHKELISIEKERLAIEKRKIIVLEKYLARRNKV